MPDSGQYVIAVLLSLVNVICFRRVILNQTIINRVIISIFISILVVTLFSLLKLSIIKEMCFNFSFLTEVNYTVAVITGSVINFISLWLSDSVKRIK
ncbi:hypothetical protein AM380_10930 [Morganella morganii]|uniref:Phage holin family protein n=1 Tax=Morganella morganii TaxID=582 RepID=A0AAU8ZLD3_MORMO|nr:hypothetical protein AM380_10930 [Morganella morganii]